MKKETEERFNKVKEEHERVEREKKELEEKK